MSEPIFTYDWFSGNIPNWEKWLRPLREERHNLAIHALEIGCFEGKATLWLMQNILTYELDRITVIDTFKGSAEHQGLNLTDLENRFRHNLEDYITHIDIFVGESQSVLRGLGYDNYHLIYVDGSHEAPDVLEDAILSFRILNPNGIMIFDDYGWHGFDEPQRNPKLAIDTFLDVFKGKYEIIDIGYQVCIKKNA